MSQHYFSLIHEGVETTVLMGWDRPLQGYFMVIEKSTDKDSPYWSNLDYVNSHPDSLDPFLAELEHLGIKLPCQMILEVVDDSFKNVGNKSVSHEIIGGVYHRSE